MAASNGPNHMLQFLDVLSAVFVEPVDGYEINFFAPVGGPAMLRTMVAKAERHPHTDSLPITNTDDAL